MLRYRWSLAITALVVAAIAVLIARGVMRPDDAQRPSRISGAVDLAPPSPMTDSERAAAGSGLDPEASVKLDAGAWVEVADPKTGRLAQRYSAEQVDPLPDQWVRLAQPRASFHTESGRVVTLAGDRATARVPRRALQSGTVNGNVVIRLFRPDAHGHVDPTRDAPALEIHTQEAIFDADIGQLHCEEEVEVFTPAARFRGRGLTLTLDAEGDAPERLVVERAVAPILIDLNRLQQPPSPPAAPGVATAAGCDAGRRRTRTRRCRGRRSCRCPTGGSASRDDNRSTATISTGVSFARATGSAARTPPADHADRAGGGCASRAERRRRATCRSVASLLPPDLARRREGRPSPRRRREHHRWIVVGDHLLAGGRRREQRDLHEQLARPARLARFAAGAPPRDQRARLDGVARRRR